MSHILITGGSGFIAAHVLHQALEQGHSVITTVRSSEKADQIKVAYPQYISSKKLGFAIVEDIAKPHAFDKAVQSEPAFDTVIHTASPFHAHAEDIQRDFLDPAIIGTTGILQSIKTYAPSVKRVVITSSFAAMIDASKGLRKGYTYSEKDWSPVTHEEALTSQSLGYRASKTFAERAAWEFLEKEKPNFTLTTMNPPLVLGPVIHHLASLDALNTSNQRARDMLQGKMRDEIADTSIYLYVDVRDLAQAHLNAAASAEAQNKRFFVVAGKFSNKMIADVLRHTCGDAKHKDLLPKPDAKGGDFPEGSPDGVMGYDNSRSTQLLHLKYRPFQDTAADLGKSLVEKGA